MNVAQALGSTIGEEVKINLSIGSSEIGRTTMRSPMLTVQAAPTSTSLVRGASCDICLPVHDKDEAEFRPLHMSWLLVTDTNGNPRLQMQWVVDR